MEIANYMIGILMALVAYALLYLGKGVQKYAIVGFTKKGATRREKGKHSGIWIFGLVLTASFMFIHWVALYFCDRVSIIAPFEGFGLLVLVVFSYLVLKERITRTMAYGIALIIIGTIVTGVFMSTPTGESSYFNFNLFVISLCSIFGFFIMLGLISKINEYKLAGLIFGTFAGTFMCFQTLTKRISWLEGYHYVTFIMFGFAAATLLMTNFAFLKAKAVEVVPSFTAVSITMPTILATFIFKEPVVSFQWIGIMTIVVGVVLLTAFSGGTAFSRGKRPP